MCKNMIKTKSKALEDGVIITKQGLGLLVCGDPTA
jgi:hypothetical protein